MPFPRQLARHAFAAAALAFCASTAQAGAIRVNSHFLQADTSASDSLDQRTDAVDDTRFNDALESRSLAAQGLPSVARAAQDVLFDAQHGAAGFLESSLALGAGVSGSAESLLFVAFDIAGLSAFTLDGSAALDGNASATRRLRLLMDVVGGDDIEIFNLDFATAGFSLSGLLDAGSYLFSVSTQSSSNDPGESSRNRIDFDFRFDTVPGGNTVPEPGSLALVLGGLWAAHTLRRRGPLK